MVLAVSPPNNTAGISHVHSPEDVDMAWTGRVPQKVEPGDRWIGHKDSVRRSERPQRQRPSGFVFAVGSELFFLGKSAFLKVALPCHNYPSRGVYVYVYVT